MVSYQKVTANYVPAAAVIRRWRALSGMIGRKGCVGGRSSLEYKVWAQPVLALETDQLENRRGRRNSMCSGKMRRYMEEHRWRRRPSGLDSDTEARKRGEQIGLDTLVVHAVNDEN